MNRRDLMMLLANGAAFLFWTVARAQELGRVYRLGMLSDVPREDPTMVAAFDELRRSGFVEGQNLRVEGSFSIRDEETPKRVVCYRMGQISRICSGSRPTTSTRS